MKNKYLLKFLLCPALSLLVAGCGTQHIKLGYVATPGAKGPLSTIKPMTVALRVVDDRDTNERDRQADIKNGLGMKVGTAVSDQEVTSVLFDALKSEFENNGHKIVAPEVQNADTQMEVALKRLWSETKMRMCDIETLGTINTVVTIRDGHNPSNPFIKSINSSANRSDVAMIGGGPHEAALNAVLKEYIRNLTYDPSILKALEASSKVQ